MGIVRGRAGSPPDFSERRAWPARANRPRGGFVGFIPEGELEKVRQAADIVQLIGEKIALKKAGRHFKAVCPFHAEKTPSFMVNPEKQIYHCFGCGEGGNVFSFIMKYEGLEFPEAVERVAEKFGVVITRQAGDPVSLRKVRSEKETLFRINQLAGRRFFENLKDPEKRRKARAYLEVRKIREEMIPEHLLGYAAGGQDLVTLFREKNVPFDKAEQLGLIRRGERGDYYDFFRDRLIFPIFSLDQKILGFSGRSLEKEQEPKYLNSPDSPIYSKGESFLGLPSARAAIHERDAVVLVEGNFDQLRLYQEGIRNVVAPLGTAVTERQIRILSRHTQHFVLLFDGDAAGQQAELRALEIFLPLGFLPRAVTLPPDQDPDSFVLERGAEAMSGRIEKAPDLLERVIEGLLAPAGSPAERSQGIKRVTELLSLLPGDIEKTLYIQEVASRSGVPVGVISRAVLNHRKKGRNFPAGRAEETGKVVEKARYPAVEQTLLELLIAEQAPPEEMFRGVTGTDFGSGTLGELWEALRGDFESHGSIDVARVISLEPAEEKRRILTSLAMGTAKWQESAQGAVQECMQRFWQDRTKERLRRISREIRDAEREADAMKVQELLRQKNEILKELTTRH